MGDIRISPTLEHVIVGTAINGNEFEGRVMAAQLFQFAEDPRLTENPKAYTGNTQLEELRRLRLEVQRFFMGENEEERGGLLQLHLQRLRG